MPRQYTPKIERTCETCGKVFYCLPSQIRKSGARFCSHACINRKHGGVSASSEHRSEYAIWKLMRQRCNSPTHHAYPHYGGRGITICPEWDDFAQFLADMGPRPTPAHELDRIDNDGPYSGTNCRWATRTEQMNNVRRNVQLTHNGRTLTAAEWARELGCHANVLYGRLRHGWSVADAVSIPAGSRPNGNKSRDTKTGRFA